MYASSAGGGIRPVTRAWRLEQRPIFVVGCPRSGTTLLRLILDSHSQISCGPETHLMIHLSPMFDRWGALSQYGYSREYWLDRAAEFFGRPLADYAAERGKVRWADKTPMNAVVLDFITDTFPNAQVVHLIRDGRDVVASHRFSWGYRAALSSVLRWHRYVSAARAFATHARPGQYIEVRYEALVAEPEATLRPLFAFLGEPWEPAVLDFLNADHDVNPAYRPSTDARRRLSDDDRPIYASRVGQGATLDPLLSVLFTARNGRLRRRLGYR